MTNQIYPCLWFRKDAKQAAEFYCSVFKHARITDENPIVVMFELNGQPFMALNGNPEFEFNESASLVVPCDNQEEIDHYWNKLTENGGQESRCGWLKDKFGVSWQIIPKNIGSLISNPEKGDRAMQAMLKMGKLDIAALENA